jgi:hypothetical protein
MCEGGAAIYLGYQMGVVRHRANVYDGQGVRDLDARGQRVWVEHPRKLQKLQLCVF